MPSTNRRAEILRAAGHTEAAAILDALEADTGHAEHEHEPPPVTPEQARQQLGAERSVTPALTDLDERRQGADLAVRRAQAERDGYVAEAYRQLVAERTPGAQQAVQAIRTALAALDAGVSAWIAEAQTQAALTRHVAGIDGRQTGW